MEVRTPPLTYTEENLSLLEKTMLFLYRNFYPAGNTSAHIHVGAGKDSTIFDLLAATTLVDEKAVKQDISEDRELEQFAALADRVHDGIIRAVKDYLDKTGERKIEQYIGKSFTVENNALELSVKRIVSRHSGTNIQAYFRHKTLEFRYFSSQVAPYPGKFQQWIKYFMLIPKVARSRNWFIIGKGKDTPLVFTREGKSRTKITILDKHGKIPKTPAESPHTLRAEKPDSETVKDLLKKKFSNAHQMKLPFAKLP
jgi:hypothetical protein